MLLQVTTRATRSRSVSAPVRPRRPLRPPRRSRLANRPVRRPRRVPPCRPSAADCSRSANQARSRPPAWTPRRTRLPRRRSLRSVFLRLAQLASRSPRGLSPVSEDHRLFRRFRLRKHRLQKWNRFFWLSAHDCQVPTPTSQNLEGEQQIRIIGITTSRNYHCLHAWANASGAD